MDDGWPCDCFFSWQLQEPPPICRGKSAVCMFSGLYLKMDMLPRVILFSWNLWYRNWGSKKVLHCSPVYLSMVVCLGCMLHGIFQLENSPRKFGCCVYVARTWWIHILIAPPEHVLLSEFATEPLTTRKHHAAVMQRLDLQEDLLHQATEASNLRLLVGEFLCGNVFNRWSSKSRLGTQSWPSWGYDEFKSLIWVENIRCIPNSRFQSTNVLCFDWDSSQFIFK